MFEGAEAKVAEPCENEQESTWARLRPTRRTLHDHTVDTLRLGQRVLSRSLPTDLDRRLSGGSPTTSGDEGAEGAIAVQRTRVGRFSSGLRWGRHRFGRFSALSRASTLTDKFAAPG